MRQKTLLWLECIVLFGLLPLPLYYMVITPAADFPIDMGGFEPRRLMFPMLWIVAIAAMLAWKRKHKPERIFRRIPWHDLKVRVLPRFLLAAVLMGIMTYILEEARFLNLPLERPYLWLMIMFFYPLISVVPQEVIFRLFFFDRYAPIFGSGGLMILMSGLAFGHAHLMFNNNIAYALSVAGGVLFALTYARTRSLSLVWLEHALYGQFVFTIGLGWYFYTGAAASHG